MATENQRKILHYLVNKESATFKELEENCSPGYYYNGSKHFGDMLSRMVKQGMIERVKKGVYKYVTNKPKSHVLYSNNPITKLF